MTHTWYVAHILDWRERKVTRYCVDLAELIKVLQTIESSGTYTLESVTTEVR